MSLSDLVLGWPSISRDNGLTGSNLLPSTAFLLPLSQNIYISKQLIGNILKNVLKFIYFDCLSKSKHSEFEL